MQMKNWSVLKYAKEDLSIYAFLNNCDLSLSTKANRSSKV